MAQNLREQIAQEVVRVLQNMQDPAPILVNREPFEPEKLAITQFPALLLQFLTEERETVSMGATGVGRRSGVIRYNIRGFLRGVELDSKRNDLIERIEEALDLDRYLGLRTEGVLDSQVTAIEVIPRLAPLAELSITFEVRYNYLRNAT
jgi:hypothetical protein